MNKAKRYHFADFTFHNYRRLLRLAQENYIFRNFLNFQKEEKYIIWRHDVDFSMKSAQRLAEIEADEGLQCTYFLHLHNNFYNLLEKENVDYGKKILAAGHILGLHFDVEFYYGNNLQSMISYMKAEKKILEIFFGCQVSVFSFHNPTRFEMEFGKKKIAGMVNAYSEYFQKKVGYCSDSNGYWRFRRLEDVLRAAEDECLQVLTHPGWWQAKPMSPYQRVKYCVEYRADNALKTYRMLLKSLNRRNID